MMRLKVLQAMRLLRHINKRISGNKGITMIELMITLVFIGLIVSVVSLSYYSSANTSRDVIDITTSEIDARLAIYRMSRDIREAKGIKTADVNQIVFFSNADSDVDVEEVTYYLESESGYYNLIRDVDSSNKRTVITNVINNDIFKYYNESSTPIGGIITPVTGTDLEKIKLVELKISVDQGGSTTIRTMDLDTLIKLRNKV